MEYQCAKKLIVPHKCQQLVHIHGTQFTIYRTVALKLLAIELKQLK